MSHEPNRSSVMVAACIVMAACGGPQADPAGAARVVPPEEARSHGAPPAEPAPESSVVAAAATSVDVTVCPRDAPVPAETAICLEVPAFDGRLERQGLYDPVHPPAGWRQIDRFTAPHHLQIFVFRSVEPRVGAQCDELLPRRVGRATMHDLVQYHGVANAGGEPLRITCLGLTAYEEEVREACQTARLAWCVDR